jgi:heptosyltransferase-2
MHTTKKRSDVQAHYSNNLRRYPDAQIDYLKATTTTVLEGNPNIDTIIGFWRKSTEKALNQPRNQINKYDLLINAYSKLESWLVVLLSVTKEAYPIRKKDALSIY